jgi:hypothetical protein
MLGIAGTAAAAIAYWWPRGAFAGIRNPGAALWQNSGSRVWLIIAVLVLALILIFWLFASPPAQASAGTNFRETPFMQ